MLPLLGFFRSVPCPYYISGLCDRPHCCFRHAVSDLKKAVNGTLEEDLGVEETSSVSNEKKNASSSVTEDESCSPQTSTNYPEGFGQVVNPESSATIEDPEQLDNTIKNVEKVHVLEDNKQSQVGEGGNLEHIPLQETLSGNVNLNGQPDQFNAESRKSSSSTKIPSGSHADKKSGRSQSHAAGHSVKDRSSGYSSKTQKSHHPTSAGHRTSSTETKRSSSHSGSSSPTKPSKHTSPKSTDSRHKINSGKPHKSASSNKHSSSSSKTKNDLSSTKSHKSSKSGADTNKQNSDNKLKTSHSSSSKHQKSSRQDHKASTSASSKTSRSKSSSKPSREKNSTEITSESLSTLESGQEMLSCMYVKDDDQLSVDSDCVEEFLLPEDQDCDDDPSELAKECLRLFTGYEPPPDSSSSKADNRTSNPKDSSQGKSEGFNESIVTPSVLAGKVRVAHMGPGIQRPASIPRTTSKINPAKRPSPAETVAKRYEQARAQVTSTTTVNCSSNISSSTTSSNHFTSSIIPKPYTSIPVAEGKKRISHVPNVSSLMKPPPKSHVATTQIPNSTLTKFNPPTPSTISQTTTKGQNRVAHRPPQSGDNVSGIPRPVLSYLSVAGNNSKIPAVCRQKLLDVIVDACLDLYDTTEEAYEKAIDIENNAFLKCGSKSVYHCKVINIVSNLRREAKEKSESSFPGKSATQARNVAQHSSHDNILAGPSGSRHSWSIETKKPSADLVGTQLYKAFLEYLMTEEDLRNHGYPQPHPSGERGHVIAVKSKEYAYRAKPANKSTVRECDRCLKSYRVREDGTALLADNCIYHHGRKYKGRVKGQLESRYSCCAGEDPNLGCTVAQCHVSASPSDELRGFVSAINEPGSAEVMGKSVWDIVGVDCEMIYTTYGTELARVTFVGSDLNVIYDELVKPHNPVLDFNTRFSGITEEQMKDVKTSIQDVQAAMLTRFKKNTILVGHSLESDLVALKFMHQYVVDTSVMMPHKMGPPYKRALRNLSSECLGKIIQAGEGGHDSAEDARAALEVVLWKIKEDLKIKDGKKRKLSLS